MVAQHEETMQSWRGRQRKPAGVVTVSKAGNVRRRQGNREGRQNGVV